MNNSIRLLVEGFFDDEIFDVKTDIKTDIEDLGKYYDYRIGDFYYNDNSKKPYAICCGESKYFKDNKPRFCLYEETNKLKWRNSNKVVKLLKKYDKLLDKFTIRDLRPFSINDVEHIDENGYENTQIIKNNYDINDFPAFKYCIELGDNIYFPAIDELQHLYINLNYINKCIKNKKFNYMKLPSIFWSSTQYDIISAFIINQDHFINTMGKVATFGRIKPFIQI